MCHQLQQEVLGPQTVRVGVAEEIVPLAVVDDIAAVHEDDAVADLLGKSHLVRDDHHRHACLCHQDHHVQNLAHHLGGPARQGVGAGLSFREEVRGMLLH